MQLTKLQPEHLPLLAGWLQQPDIQSIFGDPAEWLDEIAANLDGSDWVRYFLVCKPGPIGFCQYYDTRKAPPGPWSDAPADTAGIDFMIGDAGQRGKGLGQELVQLLLEKIRADGRFRYAVADPEPDNLPSIRVLEKCGFMQTQAGLYQVALGEPQPIRPTAQSRRTGTGNLREVAAVFLKLGCIAFGGPAAHIAMLEQEIVSKRRWMPRAHFLDLVGATNLIPGPNSTEMVMHCGHERAGTAGLFVAGACFILPAVLITGLFAWLYARYGQLPEVAPFVFGIKPAVLAIIAAAVWKLGGKALKNWELGVLGALTLAAALAGVHEITALLGAGLLGALYFYWKSGRDGGAAGIWPVILLQAPAVGLPAISTLKIFWVFLKVGSVLYGSGYVLFAYLDAELVSTGWLSRLQLIDAVAVGQFTPGPVLSTATFIGYQLGGFSGAVGATLGIFLPSFVFVWLLNPLVPRMRQSRFLAGFLDAVNSAAVAVMVAVLFKMSLESLIDWRAWLIAALGTGLTFGFKKLNAVWLVAGGAVMGYLLQLI